MGILRRFLLEVVLVVVSAIGGAAVSQFVFPTISPQLDYFLYRKLGLTWFGPEFVLIVDERAVANPSITNPGERVTVNRAFCGWSTVYCIQDRVIPEASLDPEDWRLAGEVLAQLALVVQDAGKTRGVAGVNLRTNSVSVYQLNAMDNGYVGFSYGCSRNPGDISSTFASHHAYWGPIEELISQPLMGTEDNVTGYIGLEKLTFEKFRAYLDKIEKERKPGEPERQRVVVNNC